MSKIKAIGNGFIQIDETLINLIQYKQIEKFHFGYDEDPEGHAAYGIRVIPLNPNEESIANGVDGASMITTYQENEVNEFETDFEVIISAFDNKK